MSKTIVWTNEDDQKLVDFIRAGWSCRQMAEYFERPRNGVIGRIFRQNLRLKAKQEEREDAEKVAREEAERKVRRQISDRELASYLMYPEVFVDYAKHRRAHADVANLPTPVFFYGPEPDVEFTIDLERGKTMVVSFRAVSEPDDDGHRTVFFELNGQPRTVRVTDASLAAAGRAHRKADDGDPGQVGAPMPGLIVGVAVAAGQRVERGERLFTIEAMKMETAVYAETTATVREVAVEAGHRVEAHDLIVVPDPDG